MAEELQYTVKFKTTSEGSGAKQTADGINGVTEAQKRHNKTQADGKQGRDALLRSMTDTADKARVNEFAFYDLDAAQTRTKNTAEELGRGVEAVGKKSKVGADGLLQVAYAADDVQYGIRGILNNIPGLVIGLGGTAGLAGGVSIAVLAISQLISAFGKASDGAENLKETSEDVLTNAANGVLNVLEKQKGALEDQAKKAKLAMTPDTAGDEAVSKAAKSRKEQLKTIGVVTEQLNQLLGRQTTALETLAETERASAAARKIATDEAIAAENKKVEAAANALKTAEIDRDAKEQALALAQLNASAVESEIKKLERKKALLSEIASGSTTPVQVGGSLAASAAASADNVSTHAKVDLQNVENDLNKAATEANNFRSAADKMVTTLSRYDDVIAGAAQALERQQAASAQNVETIMQKQGVAAAADTATGLQATVSDTAKRLSEALEVAKGEAGVAGQAVAEAKALLENGLTTEELKKLPGLITQILGTYKGDLSQVVGTLEEVQKTSPLVASRLERLAAEVRAINGKLANRGTGSP